ncbi:hypothetical protein F0562_006731 [Nyssa sinensis]|uniref:Uncharacterized protein n=1 Tax=Nyssa sinensis TaxID=561372 RepID=A0A5J5APL2_9ASTE|nr:hypothetical protein F0562_006731 [Nyssa sinensis]
MGSCLSKKSPISSSPSALPDPPDQSKLITEVEKKKTEEETLKKEIFIIKHRKSHDTDRRSEEEKSRVDQKVTCTTASTTTSNTTCEAAEIGDNSISSKVMNGGLASGGGIVVRTSSCTKEEVDAILIQCGRLSRSSSTGKAALSASGGSCDTGSDPHRSRKYSGSKRSYDFDHENINCDRDSDKRKGNGAEYDDNVVGGDDDEIVAAERINRHRQRQRQSRTSSSSPHGRRRTPSRERDQQQLQRSGSRERGSIGGSGGGRRVSRSPGRRSESPITPSNGVTSATPSSANASSNRPGKMVSVPATVSSLAMAKSNNGGGGGGGGGCAEPPTAAAIKRISVRRNAGDPAMGSRTVASPRSRSPARANVRASNENQNAHTNQYQQQPLSLSRSNSRKAEQSPCRRNPLSEIDQNSLRLEQPSNKNASNNNILSQTPMQKPNVENVSNNKNVVQGPPDKVVAVNFRAKEQRPPIVEEAKVLQPITRDITVTAVASGDESLKPQTLTRTRSSRRSRDLDINPEALLNPTPSYTALLLEDIQNFHQKNTTSFSLPACVTKACSILEAVADLNSSTSSNLSCAFSDDRRRNYIPEQFKNDDNFSFGANPVVKKRLEETKEPFLESEVVVTDDLMEPSLHKYVTLRRGAVGGGDMEEQESSGSNSFVGSQQHWVSSSWEPNSADSIDCWTSSRSNAREEQGHALSESGRGLCGKKKESDYQQSGKGRGRVGSVGGLHTLPVAAAAST